MSGTVEEPSTCDLYLPYCVDWGLARNLGDPEGQRMTNYYRQNCCAYISKSQERLSNKKLRSKSEILRFME